MTLWCLFRSPLMVGAELNDNDEFTLNLLTNDEVLALLSESRNARQVYREERYNYAGEVIVWQAENEQGETYCAVFDIAARRRVSWRYSLSSALGLEGAYTGRDLWAHGNPRGPCAGGRGAEPRRAPGEADRRNEKYKTKREKTRWGKIKCFMKSEQVQSRAGTGENQRGEKGRGGMARGGRKGCPSISPLRAGGAYTLLDAEGSGMVRRIWFTFPPNDPMAMRCIILRIYWDGQEQPSVEVPMGDFFGLPHGVNRDLQSEYIQVNAGTAYNCWIPMPFRKHARITVENDGEHDIAHLFYEVDYTLGDEIPEDAGYFHAQFRRQNPCPMHSDYTLLETTGKGVYLGTVLGVRSLYTESWWGEGEMKFALDGDTRLSHHLRHGHGGLYRLCLGHGRALHAAVRMPPLR